MIVIFCMIIIIIILLLLLFIMRFCKGMYWETNHETVTFETVIMLIAASPIAASGVFRWVPVGQHMGISRIPTSHLMVNTG